MLEAVCDLAPEIYPLVHSAYSTPSNLFWGDHTIKSSEGVQQGDPLGPLLFCLSPSSLCWIEVSFLCDVRGHVNDILHDLSVIKEAEAMDLALNNTKSEIICHDTIARGNHHLLSSRSSGDMPR